MHAAQAPKTKRSKENQIQKSPRNEESEQKTVANARAIKAPMKAEWFPPVGASAGTGARCEERKPCTKKHTKNDLEAAGTHNAAAAKNRQRSATQP